MKALVFAAAIAAAASVAGFASAAPPADVSIQLFPTTFCCPEAGTWQASGGISDSGTYIRTDVHGTGSLPDCFCPPTHTGAFQETFLLTSTAGTFVVKAEEQVTPTGDVFGKTTGVWQVMAGTGAYAALSGHGTDEFLFGPPLTLALTGVVSKAD
jgi:hypothetical protein